MSCTLRDVTVRSAITFKKITYVKLRTPETTSAESATSHVESNYFKFIK